MRFAAPLLLAAAVSATSFVYNNLKLTSNNEADCTSCTTLNGDNPMALQFCLLLVPPECTYTIEATLTGDATVCASANTYGIDLGDITGGIDGVEVTSMKGSLDLTLPTGTTGTCNLKGTVVDDITQQCSGAPPKEDITAQLKDGKGTLALDDKVVGRYISFKADPADACGTNIVSAKFPEAGATATLTAKGLLAFPGSDGVAPVFGASLLAGLLAALHIA